MSAIYGYTTRFKLKLVNFDWATWHDTEWENWQVMDALIYNYLTLANVRGAWANSTAYAISDKAVDPTAGTIWECVASHTSSASGTFSTERSTYPTYWSQIGGAVDADAAAQYAQQARSYMGTAMLAMNETKLRIGDIDNSVNEAQAFAQSAAALNAIAGDYARRANASYIATAALAADMLSNQVYGL